VKRWFHRVVLSRPWLTFIVMGLAFFVFGVTTLNLFMLLKANADLLNEYGWQAVMDGGFQQLVELVATGYASLLFYLVFKVCEDRLAKGLGARQTGDAGRGDAPPAPDSGGGGGGGGQAAQSRITLPD
jgi:hypothetical protein